MEDFRQVLEDCSLYDCLKYTWNNGQEGRSFTKERLDRAVANPKWCEMWPWVMVMFLRGGVRTTIHY
jgi:hypothetical protein